MVKLIPKEISQANWPEARDLTQQENEKYEKVRERFVSENARDILGRTSNLFKILLLNQEGIRTATLPEIDLLWQNNPDFIRGHYIDSRDVVLRSEEDSYKPNTQIVKYLTKIVSKSGRFKTPRILRGLVIEETDDPEYEYYGLKLVEGDNFEVIEAPDFTFANNQRQFLAINPDYTFEWCDKRIKGARNFYAKPNGVSRAILGWEGCDSNWGNLDDSDDGGRVVGIDAEGVAPKNLDNYLINLEKQRQKQLEEIESKYQKACKVMQGK